MLGKDRQGSLYVI